MRNGRGIIFTSWGLLLGAVAYLLPGIIGHGPWKQDETYTFGIIQHMLVSGDLLVPVNAGAPFMEKPPLYDWLAAALAHFFSPWLPLHDGARLASAVFMAIALSFAAGSARLMHGTRSWRGPEVLASLALFGCSFGVLKHAHDMFTDVALVAGAAIAFYGLLRLVLSMRADGSGADPSVQGGSIWLGIGVGVSLMSKGVFVPLVFGATAFLMPLLVRQCRSWSYARWVGLAVLVFAPFALVWPVLLYERSVWLFMAWFWDNNVGRFFGFSVPRLGAENDQPLFVLRVMWGFGMPAVPLAALGLMTGGWKTWRDPRTAVPLLFCGIGLAVLLSSSTVRALYLLPFILPFALLAARDLVRLPKLFHVGFDWFSRSLFSIAAIAVWAAWWLARQPVAEHGPLRMLDKWLPVDYVVPFQMLPVCAAIALTVTCAWFVWSAAGQTVWRGVLSWGAGAVLVWGLLFTLLLPWLDQAKSYGPVFTNLASHIDSQWHASDCIASLELGESEAPMLYYYTGLLHRPIINSARTACRWLIVQGKYGDSVVPPGNWQLFWSGARQGDFSQSLRVFAQRNSGAVGGTATAATPSQYPVQ